MKCYDIDDMTSLIRSIHVATRAADTRASPAASRELWGRARAAAAPARRLWRCLTDTSSPINTQPTASSPSPEARKLKAAPTLSCALYRERAAK